MGCDEKPDVFYSKINYFNPRSPNGLRRIKIITNKCLYNISIHAARMGCDKAMLLKGQQEALISIHAARMGCDPRPKPLPQPPINFNPRSPNGLRRLLTKRFCRALRFQSTQPEWAATIIYLLILVFTFDFNPRSPNGLRPSCPPWLLGGSWYFNPRSPNGLRLHLIKPMFRTQKFQSTQPEWAATRLSSGRRTCRKHFNPRSPNGLRR